jgi:hypothetical protein
MINKTKTTRITLDLPVDLHTKIKTVASQKGETLKQFFVELASGETQPKQTSNKSFDGLQKKIRPRPTALKLNTDQIDLQKEIENTWLPKF